MSSSSLESALVRLLIDTQDPRKPVGAGFLVTPNHVITCAHVVNDALKRPQSSPDQPDAEIFLDFSLVKDQPLLRARVLHWYPVLVDSAVGELEDIAVLELLSDSPLPARLRPAPVVVVAEQEGFLTESKVRMCGFPAGVDHGTYANGILQGRTAKGWVEIHHRGDNLVEQGFSGTAVWAVAENAVCGMTVSVLNRRNTVVAYMIPASVLIAAFPEMEKLSRPANPYRGLEAFREKDAKLYFGREQTITRVQQVIADQPFAAVIGASGSGKSSVVFAGLVPALRQSGDWLITHCRPKNQPLYELAACLIPLLYDDPLMRSERTDVLHKKFSMGKITLKSLIRQIRKKYEGQDFLLIVDQFEELFTLNADTKLIRQYIDLLLECLHTKQFTVLCTMRADFFAAAVSHPALAQTLDSYAPIILPQLDEQGLREAVEQPASSLGIRFADGLVDLIIRDVGQEPGSLPLLEFCLTQLWERQEFREINHDAYKAIGGVQQALANHADAVYGEFAEEEREQLRHIFLKLVRPGQGTEDTRQVASVGQIAEEYRGLITRLADKRLLVTGRDEERGEETVEVVHEALIRRWQTLRSWVDEEREFLVWQEKLQVLLEQWEESKEDEGALLRGLPLDEALRSRETHGVHLADKEREFIGASGQLREKEQQAKKRRGQYLVIGLVGAVVLAVLAGVFGLEARRQQVVAEQERHRAVEQKGIAEQKTVEAEKEKARAEQQTLAANYNLAKAFEEKALMALEKAEDDQNNESYKKIMLFTSAALTQNIENNKSALRKSSITRLFVPEIFNNALTEQWNSPSVNFNESSALCVAFSPDGKTLASASGGRLYSKDNTVRLWNIETGNEKTVFKGHEERVNSVAFSPDGKTLASASGGDWYSKDNTVRLWNIETGTEITAFKGHQSPVNSVVFSPDGKTLASASGTLLNSKDNTVRLWNIETGTEITAFKGHRSPVNSVAFSPDGITLASASFDKTVRLWDIETGKERIVFKGHQAPVESVAFSPDGKILASASRDNTVRLWDIETGKEKIVFKRHESWVTSVAFNPDGKTLASASDDNTVRLWDIKTGKEKNVFKGHQYSFNSVAFSPDGKVLALTSVNDSVRLWDIETGKEKTVLKGHQAAVESVAFSPDGKTLASASDDYTVRLWDMETGKEKNVFKGHEKRVESVIFSPDGKTLASASYDYTIRLWDIKTGKEKNLFKGHKTYINSVAFSPDGKILASASDDNTVRLWDIEAGKEKIIFKGHENDVNSVAFSPDGKTLASASDDLTVWLWEIKTGKRKKVFKGHKSPVLSVAFSPDGKTLASTSGAFLLNGDNTVRLWDIASGKELTVFKGHEKHVNSVTFSPDGKILASASGDNTVRLWHIETGKEKTVLKGHENNVTSVAFSPNGKTLVSASWDDTVRMWDIETGKKKTVFKGHKSYVLSVAFSPDGKILASASYDKTVRLWNIETGKELNVFKGHEDWVTSVAFSPDGKTLASASDDYTVRLWDIETGKEKIVFKGHEYAFSLDGKTLAYYSGSNTVRLWDIETGKEKIVFKGHQYSVQCMAFSPDGKTMALVSYDQTVRLWDIETGKEKIVFKGHGGWGSSVTFSPDGKTLASYSEVGCNENQTVLLWDIETGKEKTVFKGHESCVTSVAFSPDGRTVASASKDDTVRLWDIETGKEKIVFKGHESWVTSVAFSPDGKTLASASYDKTVRLWNEDMNLYPLFLDKGKATSLYRSFIEGIQFLWQVKLDGLEFVPAEYKRTRTLYAQDGYNFVCDPKFLPLLPPPPPNQSKFDQVLEWAKKQQEK